MRYFFMVLSMGIFAFASAVAQPSISIIPAPVSIQKGEGQFRLDDNVILLVDKDNPALTRMAALFSNWIKPATGLDLKVSDHSSNAAKTIRLALVKSIKEIKSDEGYVLKVTEKNVLITAVKPSGLFYGLQTLRQLLPASIESSLRQPVEWLIPSVLITDYPRFAWRGLLLDVSRHFFSKAFVMRYIDEMARYKLNTLHLHLTDDQGWRIEIKAFPRLTEVGAWRVPRTGRWWTYDPPKPGEAPSYGGFYTQDDIRELVQYARERQVAILPEIDVPGHSLAAIAAYPYLSATGYLYPVNPGSKFYNIEDNTLNPADEKVYEFMDKVLAEIASLFPHPYIHIGGDECTKKFWHQSAEVQAFMQKQNIKTEHELQSYFIKRLEKMLQQKGKKLIGWDEILEGGLAPDATVMSWRGMEGGIEAAKQGHKVVMTPADNVYLDLYQGDPATEPDTYSLLRLKTAYQWNPVPDKVNADLILGGQGNLWTESVPSDRHAEYMTWPRGMALSEVFWTPLVQQSWSVFQQKLETHFDRLDAAAINYSKAAFDVLVSTYTDAEKKVLMAELSTDIDHLNIYYTIDNTNPDTYSKQYTGQPLVIPEGIYQLRAMAYRNNKPVSKLLVLNRTELEKRATTK